MYPITFNELSNDEAHEYIDLAIKSDGFAYAFLKEIEKYCMPESVYMQLFFTTEHHAILFELKNR